MKKKTKELGFRYTGSTPYYISSEELLEASKDCLSHQIIETDREKLLSVLCKLDARGVENTIFEDKSWAELAKYFFGFLIFNERNAATLGEIYEILLVQKHNAPKELISFHDVVLLQVYEDEDDESTVTTYGSILNAEPLIIDVESLGNVWGYVQTKKGIEDVEICSPYTGNPYDLDPDEQLSEKPFVRNPEESNK